LLEEPAAASRPPSAPAPVEGHANGVAAEPAAAIG
jgi:hypothetical protein